MEGPEGVAQELAADGDEIGPFVDQDLLGLRGLPYLAHGAGRDAGLPPHLIGKRRLVARPRLNLLFRAVDDNSKW